MNTIQQYFHLSLHLEGKKKYIYIKTGTHGLQNN